MNILCTICARGGSKGLKNKNLRILAGIPLITHSVIQAKKSGLFHSIAVSSDSEQLLNIAGESGAHIIIKRPCSLATDESAKLPAIKHCVQEVEKRLGFKFNIIVDLDVTSPLRSADDIKGAVNLLLDKDVSNVITGTTAHRSPYFNLVEVNDNGRVTLSKELKTPIVRRQDSPKCYDMNASIYVWKRDILLTSNTIFNKDTLLFVMPQERSFDIDSEFDFQLVEFLMANKKSKK